MFKRKDDEETNKKCGVKLESLILPNAKIRFSPEQLQNLNFIFNKKLQYRQDYADKTIVNAKSVAERLIQRLLCAVGTADPRFASKFLIDNSISNFKDIHRNKLSYTMRLDDLSSPSLYELDSAPKLELIEIDPDCPAGYCRIRLPTVKVKFWSEFVNSSGFLRRDKVQTRLVELLAKAAENDTPNSPLKVDESILCGIPGKVLDPASLHHLLKVPSFEQIFYGPGGSLPRFPDPRDFRIAIVDEPEGIRLKVEFLSPIFNNTCLNIRLFVGVEVDAWPTSANFPRRIPLVHPDCLLYNKAASTGMYLYGFGVQSSAWQMRLPSAENVILGQFSEYSNIKTILDVLINSIQEIEISRNLRKHQISYKILNRYTLLTALLDELEINSSTPLNDLIDWSPMYLSSLVLKILDQLMSSLVKQMLPNYFFKESNLLVNPGHLSEDDYFIESNNIKLYMLRLYDESITSLVGEELFKNMIRTQESELILLSKWKELITGMLPKITSKSKRFCFLRTQNRDRVTYSQYTSSQLDYLSLVLKSILNVKHNMIESKTNMVENFESNESETQQILEDIIYLIILLMEQAKDLYISKNVNIKKKSSKLRSQYNQYTLKFIDIIRKDQSLQCNMDDDQVIVRIILKWLYEAIDFNKKYLAPVLEPYLSKLFITSYAISWHLDAIKERYNTDELKSLGCFCKLVNAGEITPAQGLMDASNKNWIWAKDILSIVEKQTLRIVFISDRGKIYRHILSLPSYKKKDGVSRSSSMKTGTFSNRSYFNTIIKKEQGDFQEDDSPQHEILKTNSPLSVILDKFNRKGEHRSCGDIFKSLMSMQKMNIFHEVSMHLPEDERSKLSETIHQLQIARNRRRDKKWSNTLPNIQRTSTFTSKDLVQKYTPMTENAGHEKTQESIKDEKIETNTLIKNCRALRLKEDNINVPFQNDLRIKTLLRKSESFKY